MADFFDVMESRRATKVYKADVEISREELTEILEAAGAAPSAWNLQQWNFIVIQSEEAKKKLLPIAYNQQQIVESSAVIAVLGDLEANKNIDPVFDPAVEGGHMTPEIKQVLAGQINGAYASPQYARDAAYSNASLASMQLMLAAKAKGWDTCPIGGFNPAQFVEEFNVDSRYIPVMLITVGKALKEGRESGRLPIQELTTWV
ncbi:nitroreductase family protein [Mangrovibacillus cuniculi]|uniref:Nitroreductase family protein n=1 Tax=Mangrovibacillus cuniculi TaxID=2593652 RepID=A0A7S8HEK8_9BACI|nr:nitroreductase family protein [Mangrovibacillus cuniculi]QPC45833.1 nitroreductase family protein [Mangrovibacillus cuniculi]